MICTIETEFRPRVRWGRCLLWEREGERGSKDGRDTVGLGLTVPSIMMTSVATSAFDHVLVLGFPLFYCMHYIMVTSRSCATLQFLFC